MHHLAFHLNREFIDRIYKKIREIKKQYTQDKNFTSLFINNYLASKDQLAQIIDTANWASQAIEERHQIQFSIVYKEREHSSNIFSFESPIPLNSNNLVKLGSALDSSFSDICISSDKEGKLKIWGLRMRSPSHLTIDLWIQVLGPGNLLIICYGRSIAALINNQAVFVDPASLLSAITPKIFSNGANIENDLLKFRRLYTLLYIVQAMRAHNCGGTLLVVPEGSAWEKSLVHPIIYAGGSSFSEPELISNPPPTMNSVRGIFTLFQEAAAVQDENFIKIRMQTLEQCNRIGRLTAIDGALVMTYDRDTRCFGAKIQAVNPLSGSTEVRVIKPAEGDHGTKVIFADMGGTRHCSAAQFAYDQPDSIAIVASQSGSISFFTREASTGELLVIQKAELALMYEGVSGVIWNLFQFIDKGDDKKQIV